MSSEDAPPGGATAGPGGSTVDPGGSSGPGVGGSSGPGAGGSSGPGAGSAGVDRPGRSSTSSSEVSSSRGTSRGNMLPGRERRRFGLERLVVRLIATFGIVGIGVALGAILAAGKVQGWIIGLVVAGVSVILAGLLWSSRQL